ncbi:MAG: peptidase S41 [Bacteroidales bacterium]|nr:peptidase S41 [Bacteroidales bacterium]
MMLQSDPEPGPLAVFDHLWRDIDNRYSYLEVKEVNWDSIGTVYRQKIYTGISEKELFSVLADMLFELRDGHVNLSSNFDRSRNWSWFQDYPDNYNQNIIDKYYLKSDLFFTGPLRNQIVDSILYVNYRSFSNTIDDKHIDILLDRAKGMHGIIIDVRHNGGGNLNNGYKLASCFVDSSTVYAYQRYKTGPAADDFTSWGEMTIEPKKGERFGGPVVLLTNRRSYSASTFFAQMMRAIPRATVIGNNTGGGGGIPLFGELPNGWRYRFSATQTVNPEGEHIEHEVPADIQADIQPGDEARGIDSIIELALQYIRNEALRQEDIQYQPTR